MHALEFLTRRQTSSATLQSHKITPSQKPPLAHPGSASRCSPLTSSGGRGAAGAAGAHPALPAARCRRRRPRRRCGAGEAAACCREWPDRSSCCRLGSRTRMLRPGMRGRAENARSLAGKNSPGPWPQAWAPAGSALSTCGSASGRRWHAGRPPPPAAPPCLCDGVNRLMCVQWSMHSSTCLLFHPLPAGAAPSMAQGAHAELREAAVAAAGRSRGPHLASGGSAASAPVPLSICRRTRAAMSAYLHSKSWVDA